MGKSASSTNVSLTGCLHVENENRLISISLHKTQVQVYQIPQHETGYMKSEKRVSANSFECISTGETFMNRALIGQAQGSTLNKWVIIKIHRS